ncbi:hypothetical protein ACFW3Z_24680 [Nocardiopsis alba]|uniref:hypothetical protein n=1 Tax=Nocardiopsis alba TaxID=53437 RepID=UPI0033A92A3D
MARTLPLTLPGSLLLSDMDGPGAYSGVEHVCMDVSPKGDRYLLTRIRQISAGRKEGMCAHLISRFRPDGGLAGRLVLHLSRGVGERETLGGLPTTIDDLCVLPDGSLALTAAQGEVFLVDAELRGTIGSWGGDRSTSWDEWDVSAHLRGGFATLIRTTPAGRLLCVVPEREAGGMGTRPNLIGLAEDLLTAEERPTVRIIKALVVPGDGPFTGKWVADEGSPRLPHTIHDGAPAGPGNRPTPSLLTEVRDRGCGGVWSLSPRRADFHYEAYRVLAEDRFVIPLFESPRPDRWSSYSYALIDDRGTLIGELESPGRGDSSPIPGEHYAVVTDPARGRAYHVNHSGLYMWDADGRLLARLPTTEKAYKGLRHLKPMACAPDGALILIRPEHGLILDIEIPDDPADLGPVVAEALADHNRRRNRLKKEWKPVDWRWVENEAPLTHL